MDAIWDQRTKSVIVIGHGEYRPKGYMADAPIPMMEGENSCVHITCRTPTVYTSRGEFVPGGFYLTPTPSAYRGQIGGGTVFTENMMYYPYYTYGVQGVYFNFVDRKMHGFQSKTLGPPDGSIAFREDSGRYLSKLGYSTQYTASTTPVFLGNISQYNGVSKHTAMRILDELAWEDPLGTPLSDMYFEKLSDLRLTTNTLTNIAEVVGLAKDLRHPLKLLDDLRTAIRRRQLEGKDVKDLWLKYRYVYSTTKMDAKEVATKHKVIARENSGTFRCSGHSKLGKLQLKMDYRPTENIFERSALELLSFPKQIGVDPSLYNLWDAVPFSFVVDWFAPIGDNLERMSQMSWAASMPYDVTNVLASSTITGYQYGNRTYDIYRRFPYYPDYSFEFEGKDKASIHTWMKRGVDIVTLQKKF